MAFKMIQFIKMIPFNFKNPQVEKQNIVGIRKVIDSFISPTELDLIAPKTEDGENNTVNKSPEPPQHETRE